MANRKRKKRPVDPAVIENARQALDDQPPAREDFVQFIATMPGAGPVPSYDVVCDLDDDEIRCECTAWAESGDRPKICSHVRELCETGVLSKRRYPDLHALVVRQKAEAAEAVAQPAEPRRSFGNPVLDAFAALRKQRLVALYGHGKVTDAPRELLVGLAAYAAEHSKVGVVVALRSEQPRGQKTVVLRVLGGEADALSPTIQALKAQGLHNHSVDFEAEEGPARSFVVTVHNEEARP